MAESISFSLTARQVKSRAKIVTRRFGWWNLQPGTILNGVEDGQRICSIRIISVRMEPLNYMIEDHLYGQRECMLEGFPEMTPEEYVRMRIKNQGVIENKICNRIYFEYLEEDENETKKTATKETQESARQGRKSG
ncbi:MAG: ASCH domain-containing protein [Micavibrio sp.]